MNTPRKGNKQGRSDTRRFFSLSLDWQNIGWAFIGAALAPFVIEFLIGVSR